MTLSEVAALLAPPQQRCARDETIPPRPKPRDTKLDWKFIPDRIDRSASLRVNGLFSAGMTRIVPFEYADQIIPAEAPRCAAAMNFGCGNYRPDRSGALEVSCNRCGRFWRGYTSSNPDAVKRVEIVCGEGGGA